MAEILAFPADKPKPEIALSIHTKDGGIHDLDVHDWGLDDNGALLFLYRDNETRAVFNMAEVKCFFIVGERVSAEADGKE